MANSSSFIPTTLLSEKGDAAESVADQVEMTGCVGALGRAHGVALDSGASLSRSVLGGTTALGTLESAVEAPAASSLSYASEGTDHLEGEAYGLGMDQRAHSCRSSSGIALDESDPAHCKI